MCLKLVRFSVIVIGFTSCFFLTTLTTLVFAAKDSLSECKNTPITIPAGGDSDSSIEINGKDNYFINDIKLPFITTPSDSLFTVTLNGRNYLDQLDEFLDQAINGIWTLTIINNDSQEVTLDFWCLKVDIQTPEYRSDPSPNTTLNLGEVPVGQESPEISVEIANIGNGLLKVENPNLDSHVDEISIINLPSTIAKDEPKQFQIKCTPTTYGTFTTNLTLNSNDPDNPEITYPLTCTGLAPGFKSEPSVGEIDFGGVDVGSEKTKTIVFTNVGTADGLKISAVITNNNDNFFSITPESFNDPIPKGNNVKITVKCRPTTIHGNGISTPTLKLTHNENYKSNTVTYDLKCTGKAPEYSSFPEPSELIDFGEVEWILGAGYQYIDVENIGNAPLTVKPPTIIGADKNYFQLSDQNPPFPLELQPYGLETIVVECLPQQSREYQATLQLTTTDPQYPTVDYPLSCIGKAAIYESIPILPNSTLDFGKVLVETSVEKIIFFQNKGDADLTVGNISETPLGREITIFESPVEISGPHKGDFKWSNKNAFPFTISSGSNEQQEIKIQCTPSAAGKREANLLINSTDPNHINIKYQLTCTGIEPLYESTPIAPGETLKLGQIPTDVTAETVIEIQEIGTADLVVNTAQLTDDVGGVFSLVETDLPFTITNDSQERKAITVQCAPTETSIYTAKLQLTTNATNYPKPTYELTCEGIAPLSGPRYHSTPYLPEETIDFSTTPIAATTTRSFHIGNIGNAPLVIKLVTPRLEDFKLISPQFSPELTIPNGEKAVQVILECIPSQEGVHSTQIRFETNDPALPELSYNLKCTGIVVPGYDSTPIPPDGTIDFGSRPLAKAVSKTFQVKETGSQNLTVNLATTPITGSHVTSFSLEKSTFPFVIADNGNKDRTITVQCTPTVLGVQTATLNLTSNDPNHATIKYELKCIGTDPNQLVNLTTQTVGNDTISSQPVGNDCGMSCLAYAKETQVTLAAIPNQGYTFTHWSGDCSGTSATTTVDMNQNRTCTAHFGLLHHTLTVAIMGTGTVTSQPAGLDCPQTTCSADYLNGTTVTLAITPANNFNLSQVSGDCDVDGHVILDADKFCQITFATSATPVIKAGQLQFAQTQFTVNPETKQLILTVTRTEGNNSAVQVSYFASDHEGGKLSGIAASEGILQWQANDNKDKTFTITLTPEHFLGRDSFSIQLTDPTGGATLGNQSIATITLNRPEITPEPPSVDTTPSLVKTTLTELKLCPLTPIINIVCHLGWQTGSNLTIGEQGNVSAVFLEGTNLNMGWMGNLVVQPEATLTGGIVTGYITNHGEITEVIFRGALLEGGTLSGQIVNESPTSGIIRDFHLAPNSTLNGGDVGGQITSEGTITGIKFRGTQLSGGTLAGYIDNVSGGIIKDVILTENTHLDGGRVTGHIKGVGTGASRPILENLIISPDTQLENVRIGANVHIPEGFQFPPSVTLIEQPQVTTDNFISKTVNAEGQVLENITINEGGKLSDAQLGGTVINLGEISNVTVQSDGRVTGGILLGEINNEGTISEVELKKALLRGGALEGDIKNNDSVIKDVSLGANTQIKGGELQGNIQGDAQSPARLDVLTIAEDSYVENVIIGQKVTNRGTLANVEFQGTTLAGGILAGQIIISRGGTLHDVQFAPNTTVSGGNLQGQIQGNPEAPTHLVNVMIAAHSTLENVVIGDNVTGSQITIGNNVTLASTGEPLTSGEHDLGQPSVVEDNSSDSLATALILDVVQSQIQESVAATFKEDIRTSFDEKRSSGALLSYLDAEILKIATTITAHTQQQQTGELIVVTQYQQQDTPIYLQYDGKQKQWVPWNGDYRSLIPAQSQPLSIKPDKPIKVTVFEGDLSDHPGQYILYVGYRIKTNEGEQIVFNGNAPITFYVETAPPACIVYAVHDEGVNNTQLIKINLSGGLDGDMEPLGPLYQGYDIEGLALHTLDNNLLYGTAGSKAKVDGQLQGGYLYTIERQTGNLSLIGPTGFNKVAGLAFNAKDKTLWGWARNETKNNETKWNGLIKIDPETGRGQMIKQFDYQYNMAGLAWNFEGTQLYAAMNDQLWRYDFQTQELKLACNNVTDEGEIEGLDMQPNGSLLIGIDYDTPTQTTIFAYDPVKCQRVEGATRTFIGTYYDDMESLVWPLGECHNQSWM